MKVAVLLVFVLVQEQCSGRAVEEDSVVSVYTTQPTTSGPHPPLDVYHQIANNIADRITSPIYRFLGITRNRTEEEKTTKKSWEKIEILDDNSEEVTKPSYLPVDNDISEDRDVEELSVEALKKTDNRPEKVTLYSSYLPVKSNLENLGANETVNEVDSTASGDKSNDDESKNDDDDDTFTLDDVDENDDEEQGSFGYFFEILSSIVQLAWGGLTALFKSSSGNSSGAKGT